MSRAKKVIKLMEELNVTKDDRDYIKPEEMLGYIKKFFKREHQNIIGNKSILNVDILAAFEREWQFTVKTEDLRTGATQDYAIPIRSIDFGVYRVSQLPSASLIKPELIKWVDFIVKNC